MENGVKWVHILYGKDRGKGKYDAPFFVMYDPPSWPLRIQKRRGYDRMDIIYNRKTTPKETEWLAKCTRCVGYNYQDIHVLIEDEASELGADHEEINVLEKLKQQINGNN